MRSRNQKDTPRENFQKGLRSWYAEKSKEFTSANYERYKEEQQFKCYMQTRLDRFDQLLEEECERFRSQFQQKLRISGKVSNEEKGMKLNSKLLAHKINFNKLPNEKPLDVFRFSNIIQPSKTSPNIVAKTSSKRCFEPSVLLKPEDFCAVSSSEESSDVEEQGTCTETDSFAVEDPTFTAYTTSTIPDQPQKLLYPVRAPLTSTPTNSNRVLDRLPSFSTSAIHLELDEDLEIQNNEKNYIIAGKDANQIEANGNMHHQITHDLSSQSRLYQWLKHIEKFEETRPMKLNHQNSSRNEMRAALSRTIITQINFSTKKLASNANLAAIINFFCDILDGKPVKSWDETVTLHLNTADPELVYFMMETICDRYQEQVMWDLELVDPISFIIASLCKKYKNFYLIFCAKLLNSSTLLHFDLRKILQKVQTISVQPEVATHWIANETALFKLFCQIQSVLKPTDKDSLFQGSTKFCGFEFLRSIFLEIAQMKQPLILVNAFLLGIFLDSNGLTKKLTRNIPLFFEELLPSIRLNISNANWNDYLRKLSIHYKQLDERSLRILKVRNDSLICILENAISKIGKHN